HTVLNGLAIRCHSSENWKLLLHRTYSVQQKTYSSKAKTIWIEDCNQKRIPLSKGAMQTKAKEK
ncbi:hypothetical protein M514_17413, partial [Trichuris suis]